MGHGHAHGSHAAVEIGSRARTVLIAFLAIIGALAVAGMIWLWPSQAQLDDGIAAVPDAEGVTYFDGSITSMRDECINGIAPCRTAVVHLDDGADVDIELQGAVAQSSLRVGDSIEVFRVDTGTEQFYSYSGTNRLSVLTVMGVLFLVCVLVVARQRGLFALIGLGIAAFVLLKFMLPALIVGQPGLWVALAGSTAIMFVVLYVAHGVSVRTSTALAGTLLGLMVSTLLGVVSVKAARLSGFAEENEYDLAQLAPGLDFQELLMVAIIIGGLGVLNDVTITQSSSVWELRAAGPELTRRDLFNSGMRIGRDHIASTIYTIVFAYAGGALTILLLLYFSNRGVVPLLGNELFAGEVVRTLASAIGLILAVPITTGIAALTVGPARPNREGFARRADAPE